MTPTSVSGGLRVVGWRSLSRHPCRAVLLVAQGPHAEDLEGASHERLQGALIVRADDELYVAEPQDVVDDQSGHEILFVGPLAGYDVREDALRVHAADDDTLHDGALVSLLLELGLAGAVVLVGQVLLRQHALRRDVEVVHAYDGDGGLG